ncbi:MAG: Ppx/GppA phosphatase family protein [Acidobacteriota bacterium]
MQTESPMQAIAELPRRRPTILAAVDLGSNSFRMVIARLVKDELRPLDRLREGVRLAECLDHRQRLTAEGKNRALSCLLKFGQRLRDFPDGNVRAVGTNTLRKARNTAEFLDQAETALGHPIEVVSGQEEARLIFLGASHSLAGNNPTRRLVVDIGGGSTECIVGEAFEPIRAESLYMGCVGYTLAHFPGGKITRKRMRRAVTAAPLELRPGASDFRYVGWDQCAGASGTIHAVAEILRQNGWSDRDITRDGLETLRQTILATDHVDNLVLKGLKTDRAKVLPGGVAILSAIFESLEIDRMTVASGAMREGVLYDLLGRIRHEDARDRTIQRFIKQYDVDVPQTRRVQATALRCLDQVAGAWDLDRESSQAFLSWSASLHEIGLGIAHGGFHKHSAYLVDNSDMPGFSVQDQKILSLLVRGVRRKFPKALFAELPAGAAQTALRLCLLLRLACLLNRSRSQRTLPELTLAVSKRKLILTFPDGWLARHPLTEADLEQEKIYLKTAGIKLRLDES